MHYNDYVRAIISAMAKSLNLIEETLEHFREGARCVRAHTNDTTYIITQADKDNFWVATEEPGFKKTKTASLQTYFTHVFGIEATY